MLLSPGPVEIPPFVQEALLKPVIHHRTSAFEKMYGSVLDGLRYGFQTNDTVCTMIGSGTYGVQAAMYSRFRPDEGAVMVVNNGKFSGRWVDYGILLGLDILESKLEWGKSPQKYEILQNLDAFPGNVQGLVLTHCETSTGALTDVEEIAFAV